MLNTYSLLLLVYICEGAKHVCLVPSPRDRDAAENHPLPYSTPPTPLGHPQVLAVELESQSWKPGVSAEALLHWSVSH